MAYLAPGEGKTRQGYLWTACRPGGDVFFRWETSRAAECLERILPRDFKGVLQCDGYSAYPAFAKGRAGIELAGCWVHARSKFHEALEQSPRPAGWIMRQIQHLYRIEAALRESKAGACLRQAVRSHQSRPSALRLLPERPPSGQSGGTLPFVRAPSQKSGVPGTPPPNGGGIRVGFGVPSPLVPLPSGF